jgi:hypothetical protein
VAVRLCIGELSSHQRPGREWETWQFGPFGRTMKLQYSICDDGLTRDRQVVYVELEVGGLHAWIVAAVRR